MKKGDEMLHKEFFLNNNFLITRMEQILEWHILFIISYSQKVKYQG